MNEYINSLFIITTLWILYSLSTINWGAYSNHDGSSEADMSSIIILTLSRRNDVKPWIVRVFFKWRLIKEFADGILPIFPESVAPAVVDEADAGIYDVMLRWSYWRWMILFKISELITVGFIKKHSRSGYIKNIFKYISYMDNSFKISNQLSYPVDPMIIRSQSI